jgi:NitT/TauT family transport system substrate-binding protein
MRSTRYMRSTRILTLITALLLVAAACGDSDEGGSATTDEGGSATTAATTTTTQPGATTTQAPDTTTTTEPVELEKVGVMLDWLPGAVHLPFWAAKANGYFEEQGLDVELIPGKGSSAAAQGVAAGVEYFGFADSAAVAAVIAQDGEIRMVGVLLQNAPWSIDYFCDSGIETPADLEGKTIAGASWTANWFFLGALLNQFDLEFGPDVTQLIVDPAAQNIAVFEGLADARVAIAYDRGFAIQAERETGREACTLLYTDFGVEVLGHGLVTQSATIESNPDLVRRFVTAWVQGIEAAVADPTSARQAMQAVHPEVTDEEVDLAWPFITQVLHTNQSQGEPYGWMSPVDWANTLDQWVEFGIVEERLDPDSTYFTNEFIPTG